MHSHLTAPAFPLRSAAALWPAPCAARLDPPGTRQGEVQDGGIPASSDERSVQRSVRSEIEQPVMRSLRRNHGRLTASSPGREIRETVRSTVDR